MATTSGTLVAGKAAASGRDGGNGGRFDLRAKMALGAVTLGCAAALAFGGLHNGDAARRQPQAVPATVFTQTSGSDRQHFLASNLELPDGTLPATTATFERQRFLEQNLYLPDGTLPLATVSFELQRFLAWNTELPTGDTAPVDGQDKSGIR